MMFHFSLFLAPVVNFLSSVLLGRALIFIPYGENNLTIICFPIVGIPQSFHG